jgi:hypothetical protein
MVLRKVNLDVYDGYESPIDDKEYSSNFKFIIEGYSTQIQKGFITTERGEGANFREALDNAYNKIYNKLSIKYHIRSNTMKVSEYYKLKSSNKSKSSGFSFYTMDDTTIEEFKQDEERYQMTLEDAIELKTYNV